MHTHLQIGINLKPTSSRTRWLWLGCHNNHNSLCIVWFKQNQCVWKFIHSSVCILRVAITLQLESEDRPEKVRTNRGGAHDTSVAHSPKSVYSHLTLQTYFYYYLAQAVLTWIRARRTSETSNFFTAFDTVLNLTANSCPWLIAHSFLSIIVTIQTSRELVVATVKPI